MFVVVGMAVKKAAKAVNRLFWVFFYVGPRNGRPLIRFRTHINMYCDTGRFYVPCRRITIITIIVSYVINIARSNDDYSLPLRHRRGARDDDFAAASAAAAEIPLLFYTSAPFIDWTAAAIRACN